MTTYYRQTQNECAGAAVLHALYDPDDITPIELADAAALIDQFPTSNSKDGGTSIEACLGVAHKMGLCPAYANIGNDRTRLLDHVREGGRACLSIDSGAVNPTNGRLMAHAVCISMADAYGALVYDPAHGALRAMDWPTLHAQVSKVNRGYWLVDTDEAGVVKRVKANATRRRVTVALALTSAAGIAIAALWIAL
jgi:hypothetical protein